jgi:hypothetical protein
MYLSNEIVTFETREIETSPHPKRTKKKRTIEGDDDEFFVFDVSSSLRNEYSARRIIDKVVVAARTTNAVRSFYVIGFVDKAGRKKSVATKRRRR